MNNSKIVKVEIASVKDAEEIFQLQKLAYISEAEIYNDYTIPPLVQPVEETIEAFKTYTILKAVHQGKIIGSVRGELTDNYVYVGRLMVHPDYQNQGLGTRLMLAIEAAFPQAKKFTLGTGHLSERNLSLYHKLGYRDISSEVENDSLTIVRLEKTIP